MSKLFKVIITFLLTLCFVFISDQKVQAEGEFIIDSDIEYYLQDSGKTQVTHNITLENAFPTLYAKSYTLNLANINPENPQAFAGDTPLDLTQSKQDNLVALEVNFPDQLVGKGSRRNFSIRFMVTDFAVRTGEVWEISIPGLAKPDNYRNYSLSVSVPESLGQEAYISPEPVKREQISGRNILYFSKDQITDSGVSAGFGEFQVFNFNLNYHLENPLNHEAETEIALPPDTAFQKVYYEQISPIPQNLRLDEDGNWLAGYRLKKRERIDIKVNGSVQIYAANRPFARPSNEVLTKNLAATEYWPKNDAQIKQLAQELKTPQNIYNYVVAKLTYDYTRVKVNAERLGAVGALKNPNSAICMEFTDLFIALARAADIPAREVNGFAYTENPDIQPLSLVSDVLHSWPEYWDSQKAAWIPIDPTWGNTSGIDYFSKLDLRHFSFVIHGVSDSEPYAAGSYKLGPNPQKDVFVNFGKLPAKLNSDINVSAKIIQKIPLVGAKVLVTINNPGPLAVYDLTSSVYFDQKLATTENIPVLLPYNQTQYSFKIPFTFLGTKTPEQIRIATAGKSLEIPSYRQSVILTSLLILFIILILITLILLIKFKRQSIVDLLNKIHGLKSQKTSEQQTTD